MKLPVLLSLILAGCSAPEPYYQEVIGVVVPHEDPKGLEMGFSLATTDEPACSKIVASGMVDSEGKFSFRSRYVPALAESYSVFVKKHSVCFKRDGLWVSAWELDTGPLHKISMSCVVAAASQISCVHAAVPNYSLQGRRP